jgi:hypothetical protein
MGFYQIFHELNLLKGFFCFFVLAGFSAKSHKLITVEHKHAGDDYRFRFATSLVFCRLKGFIWVGGKTVEVDAVVSVGPADKRQPMWPFVVNNMVKGSLQMLE